MTTKFFRLANLANEAVEPISDPWNVRVPEEILALPKEAYKKRWFSPETKHWLLLLAQGQNESFCVSQGNQASVLYGWTADYDGVFTEDIIDAAKAKPPSKYAPAYWVKSHSGGLHLVWLFDRPITVMGNAHANALIHVISTKLKAVRWGVGYDPESEFVTQVMDIGREWHVFRENAFVPSEEIIAWDAALFQKSIKQMTEEVVDIPFDVVAAEIAKRDWPHEPPKDIRVGTRCLRFWAADADNQSAAQFMKDGIRVYTPHDGGFKSWKSLLGSQFCEEYTSKSMAPFYGYTFYNHSKDEYWRFFPDDRPPHFEKRTEKVLRRDLKQEARLDDKPAKGESLSEVEKALYTITRKNTVDHVAPILYRETGVVGDVPGLGKVLNTSMVYVRAAAPRVAEVTEEEAEALPTRYREDPLRCAWDNAVAVKNFPHIHRLITAFFMSQMKYDSWAEEGYPLVNANGETRHGLADRQLLSLISWMSHFYRNAARLAHNPARGTVLILAGPTGIGKSFFAKEILGQLMGGADYADKMYLEGSRFNASLAMVPVHLIDDKLGSKSQRERLKFTEALKVVTANGSIRYEAKFGSAVEGLPWPGRIVILSNVDSQSLSVLPDLDMSTRDKFMMLRLNEAKFRFGTMDENQCWLSQELPYFARFLLGWQIPEDMRDDRFGVKAIQHSDMAQASAENGLTQVLLEVLEACIQQQSGTSDPKERSDAEGYAAVGNAVQIFKWISSVDPALAREVVDSRTLQQSLSTLHKNGGYNIRLDKVTKRWYIPWVLRKSDEPSA